jgi:adenylate kinase
MGIIFLGPPGAGKGTQAKTLAAQLNIPHISTGDLFRQNVSFGTELGRQAKSFMEAGLLVPDNTVTEMLTQRFDKGDVKKGFILDGYPRNINQAKTLDKILGERGLSIGFVVYLDTSDAVIIQRLTGRLVCSSCGANFHIRNMPPKVNGSCDICRGRLYQRSDDKEDTVKKRIEVYKKEITPLIGYYEAGQKLHRLKGDEEQTLLLNKIMHLAKTHNDSLKV